MADPITTGSFGDFIGIVTGFFGGIVGLYLISIIISSVYRVKMMKALNDIKKEIQILNGKRKGHSKKNKKV